VSNEPLQVTLFVCNVLQRLGIPYIIVGSFASTVYGEIRTTLDSDLVADLTQDRVEEFVKILGTDFYADAEMILAAIKQRTCFNLIHLPSLFKVDVYIPGRRDIDREQLKRRKRLDLADQSAYFATAEDVILAKLEWFKQGRGVSERQWHDVIGILKQQKNKLDASYLRSWAGELGVIKLLEKAIAEAGLDLQMG